MFKNLKIKIISKLNFLVDLCLKVLENSRKNRNCLCRIFLSEKYTFILVLELF